MGLKLATHMFGLQLYSPVSRQAPSRAASFFVLSFIHLPPPSSFFLFFFEVGLICASVLFPARLHGWLLDRALACSQNTSGITSADG